MSFFVPSSGIPSAALNASLILDDERGWVNRNSGGASPASLLRSFIFSNISPIALGLYPALTKLAKPTLSASFSKSLLYLRLCVCIRAGPTTIAPGLLLIKANAIDEIIVKDDARLLSCAFKTFLAKCLWLK